MTSLHSLLTKTCSICYICNSLFECPMILIVFLLVGATSAQIKNPCPDILSDSPLEEGSNRWNAVLNVPAPEDLNGVWIHVNLDRKADALFNNFSEISSSNNQNYIIRKSDASIPIGDPVTVKLTIKFGDRNNIPNIKRISINGYVVCPKSNRRPPQKPMDIDVRIPTTDDTPKLPPRNKDEICGTVPQAVGLIYNGRDAEEGAWPWHVALLKIVPPYVDYVCGGSIISKKMILTAAHCVTIQRTKRLVDLQTFIIYFGLTKLSHIPASAKTSTMKNVIIPDDYNPERFFNDIALIQLPTDLEFTDFIRPVCLWSGDMEQNAIVGKQGTIIGFGVDNKNATFSSSLMEAKISPVSLETCRSRDEFYVKYTTDKTFCAGGVNGVTACPGDSGGGMIFPMPGTSGRSSIWQIRGVVSLSKRPEGTAVCDTENYVIFTDVAKHMDWIRKHAKIP